MIASQKIGKSFMGALAYNITKMNHPDNSLRAELLDTNFTSLNSKDIKKEIDLLRQLRPNLNRYVYHTSLNFPAVELQSLSNEKLLAVAHDYLNANGFTANQYMIFRHHDAGHPHLHLLANRIRFDGTVVSDSNNYKKSEAIVRAIERRYNLISVEPSNKVSQRAAKKDELEMVERTGKPSDKMVLQETMKNLLSKSRTISGLISNGEKAGIHFLFNQQSTGRISGITYFYKDFKIKGQALGNRYKWSELINKVNHEQVRDSKAISEANSRTRAIYGEQQATSEQQTDQRRIGSYQQDMGQTADSGTRKPRTATAIEEPVKTGITGSPEASQDSDFYDVKSTNYGSHKFDFVNLPQIADDVDDEAVYGKKRRRGKSVGGFGR